VNEFFLLMLANKLCTWKVLANH